MDQAKLVQFMLFYPAFLFSLAVHESAHGYVASLFGDQTAKSQGRVTLNPLAHMDIIGTFMLPILGFFSAEFVIGWGVPVPVDYRNLKNWKRDGMFIALAGPVSNILLAILFVGVIKIMSQVVPDWFVAAKGLKGSLYVQAVVSAVILNLSLCFFNLIPVHPLDGGKVLYGLLPKTLANQFNAYLAKYGFILLLALLMTGVYKYMVHVPAQWVFYQLITLFRL